MDRLTEIDVLILGAVPQEVGALTELLETCRMLPQRGQTSWLGTFSNLSILIATTGIGKVNAAITTASLLEWFSAAQVWHIGCAGAYPEGRLRIGDVLITEKALCGDEGIMTRGGVLPVSAIGIPIIVQNGEQIFDEVPLNWTGNMKSIFEKTPQGLYRQRKGPLPASASPCDKRDQRASGPSPASAGAAFERELPFLPSARQGATDEDLFHLVYGPSLTVGMVSGDPEVAGERFQHYGAYAENMEGSAVAHACRLFGTAMVECRGISNLAGNRAKETWQLEKSIAHCHGIIINWLEALNSVKLQQ